MTLSGRETFRAAETLELLSALDDDLTAAIVTALRADAMIHHGCTAVRADAQGRDGSEVMRSSLIPSLLGDFMFRMCHCYKFL